MRSKSGLEDSFGKQSKASVTLGEKKSCQNIVSHYSFHINIYSIPVTCFFNFSISSFKLLISKSLLAVIGPSTVEYCRAWTVWVDSRKRWKRQGQIICLTCEVIKKILRIN